MKEGSRDSDSERIGTTAPGMAAFALVEGFLGVNGRKTEIFSPASAGGFRKGVRDLLLK
jgi:hypothetical protein